MAQLHISSTGLAAVSAQSLIAAPPAGKRIVVLGYAVSVGATASDVTLSFSATNQKVWQFAANGHAEVFGRWEGDGATALTITTSAAGPTDVSIDYAIENVS